MRVIATVLMLLPAPGLMACVSDLSPDPYKKSGDLAPADAGGASSDAARPRDSGSVVSDARAATQPGKDASSAPPASSEDGGADPAPDEAGTDEPAPQASSSCDLSGRWIMTERAMSSAYGARQINLLWHYVELEQQGSSVTMKKTLLCGGSTQGEPGGFPVMMDDSQAWPSYELNTNYNGRKGTSVANGGECDVKFEEATLIRGMTPEYKDADVALPTLAQEASGSTPGWQDWDQDGKPGVTMNVSGSASGKVFTAFRTSSNYSGSVAADAMDFQLDYDWVQDRAVLGTEPSDPITRSLLASPAERAPDPGKNYVELARLAANQATGDDTAVCEAIRTLAPTLNATANKI